LWDSGKLCQRYSGVVVDLACVSDVVSAPGTTPVTIVPCFGALGDSWKDCKPSSVSMRTSVRRLVSMLVRTTQANVNSLVGCDASISIDGC
jgi:hypothetical protein